MMEFEWDPNKSEVNLSKHGVSFSEASTVFGDPLALTSYDFDNSDEEDRYVTMGESSNEQLLIVSHTDRDNRIRIISARPATRRERKVYEND